MTENDDGPSTNARFAAENSMSRRKWPRHAGLMTQSNRLNSAPSIRARQVAPPRRTRPSTLRPKEVSNRLRPKIQNFVYQAPAAKSVQLVGDFTNWLERPINLRRHPEGTWWTAVRLQVGIHYYRFLVDGVWQDDPDCQFFVSNPFGSRNCVREVT